MKNDHLCYCTYISLCLEGTTTANNLTRCVPYLYWFIHISLGLEGTTTAKSLKRYVPCLFWFIHTLLVEAAIFQEKETLFTDQPQVRKPASRVLFAPAICSHHHGWTSRCVHINKSRSLCRTEQQDSHN